MTEIINGTTLAAQHEELLRKKLEGLTLGHRPPTLVSFCNIYDFPSVQYTKMKAKKAASLGIRFVTEEYSPNSRRETLAEKIQNYNNDPEVDGIMVQLPLPERLRVFKEELLELITPGKDVDGLTIEGRKIYMPATVRGVVSILDDDIGKWVTKVVAVVGSSGEVGRPMVEMLRKRGIQDIIEVDRDLGDISKDLNRADLVISCTGEKGLIKVVDVKPGFIAIDVGLGDFDEGAYQRASAYTPVRGGVGPMTVISLMENVVESYRVKVLK